MRKPGRDAVRICRSLVWWRDAVPAAASDLLAGLLRCGCLSGTLSPLRHPPFAGVAAGRCPRGCTIARMTSSLVPASTRFFSESCDSLARVPAWLSCGILGWLLSPRARLRMHFPVDDYTAQASAGVLLCC
ncbi:unnamed protein product, partial [Pylaiella littoralis]